MPATTPTLALPYLLDTDPAQDIADGTEDLALGVEAAIVGTNAAPVAGSGSVGTSRVFRRGRVGILAVNGMVTGAVGAGGVLLTLPVGYRPPAGHKVFGHLIVSTGALASWIEIRDDGTVRNNVALAAGTYYGSYTIPL